MKPPIRVSVKTDNMHKCSVRIEGAARDADGNPESAEIEIGTSGNPYQALHALRPHLEHAFNGLLASHGIHPDPEPEATDVEEPAPQTDPAPPPAAAVPAPVPSLAVVTPSAMPAGELVHMAPEHAADAPKATGLFAPPPPEAKPAEPEPVHTGEQTVKLGT